MTRSFHLTVQGLMLIGLILLLPRSLNAQVGHEISRLDIDAPIEAVTLYQGRALITRYASIELDAGMYNLTFPALSLAVLPDTIQAQVSGNLEVLSVDYETIDPAPTDEVASSEFDVQIRELESQLRHLSGQMKNLDAREQLLETISENTGKSTGQVVSHAEFNFETLAQHIEFLDKQREQLLVEREALQDQSRDAEEQLKWLKAQQDSQVIQSQTSLEVRIKVSVQHNTSAGIQLRYLVSDAGWEPQYNIRTYLSDQSVQVEYDAMLMQRTGEDWTDVQLTLSTAQPLLATQPPTLVPWYVDIYEPVYAGRERLRRQPPIAGGSAGSGIGQMEEIPARIRGAEIIGKGPSVTYRLPQLITIRSNIQHLQRARIANINTTADLIYVAIPYQTESVYLRGDLVNASQFQLLTGKASIFIDQEFVGTTTLDAVAPQEKFGLYLGIDHSIHVKRQLLSKKTTKTGLFGGGVKTSYDYRIEIDNDSGHALDLELWDRIPVSRSDQIEIDLVQVSRPLSTDPEYLETERPQGLLRWDFNIPTVSQGANAFAVTYGVRINRAKDTEMTPLPE